MIENTARSSYGKLLAYLSSRSRDIQACEEALAEAFKIAAEKWERDGVPENPEGWLFMVAKNHLIDVQRKSRRAFDAIETMIVSEVERMEESNVTPFFRDERLKLLFVCCHPSIDESVRTPLMLQTVLGLRSETIASAFLTSPAAMMKRLVRAKQKIKLAGIEFAEPGPEELTGRLEFVTEAIFALYGKSWDALGSSDAEFRDLDSEALYLAELLVSLVPTEPEPKGLFACLLHCESRKRARRSAENLYIPLEKQNPALWERDQILRAEKLLQDAFSSGKIGRFQIEGAIQSAHCFRVAQRANNWAEIVTLYDGLISLAPTVGAMVGRASAVAEHLGPAEGMKSLELIPADAVVSYQPYWALRAELLRRSGKIPQAVAAYDLAIGLSQDESVRMFLLNQKKLLL